MDYLKKGISKFNKNFDEILSFLMVEIAEFLQDKDALFYEPNFSLEKICDSIRLMDSITPYCDFVFTGGEPFANIESLGKMLDMVNDCYRYSVEFFAHGKEEHIHKIIELEEQIDVVVGKVTCDVVIGHSY